MGRRGSSHRRGGETGQNSRSRSSWLSLKSGAVDLRRYPLLTGVATLTVAMAAFFVLLMPTLAELTSVGEAYATMHSEVLVLLEDDLPPDAAKEALSELEKLPGVERLDPSTQEDIGLIAPGLILKYSGGEALTITPTGFVPVQEIRFQASQIQGVSDSALGLGILSSLLVELLELLLPWLTSAFGIAAVILLTTLAYQVAWLRRDEARVMRLVGASTWDILLRVTVAIAIPALIATTATTVVLGAAVPFVSSHVLPDEFLGMVGNHAIYSTGFKLVLACMVVTCLASLVATWRVSSE